MIGLTVTKKINLRYLECLSALGSTEPNPLERVPTYITFAGIS